LDNFVPGLTTLLAPTGADTHYFQPSYTSRDTLSMLFIGHYGHYPNYDAVFHFCRDILPRIVSVLPAAYFQVVGSGTKKDLAGLSDDHIHVIGEVDDVRRYLNAASIFVAPVRLGGGIKGKILEAMASGLAVVATREASGGINGRPAIEIEVADNETDFANKVVALLRSPERCQQLARNARALVEEQYDWTAIAARIDAHYDSIIKRSS
jgi:glycosyltransferase involved in cell wall biosynthesis